MVEALAGAMDSTLQDFAQLPQDQKQERAELLRKDAERTLAYFRKLPQEKQRKAVAVLMNTEEGQRKIQSGGQYNDQYSFARGQGTAGTDHQNMEKHAGEHSMKQKSSFTLLELLITIGIIALLAGILFPVMSQVRASARRTSCMNNLKQIGTGLELYGAASSYRLPDPAPGSQDPAAGPPVMEVLSPHLSNNRKIFFCPSDPLGETRENGSYDWNTLANGLQMDEKTLKVQNFFMPVMGDYDNFHGAAGKADAKNWLYLPAEVHKELKK